MESTPLTPYARLPHTYRGLHMMSSTVDAYGRAHWLLREHIPVHATSDPYEATMVTADDGRVHETHLSAVQLYRPAFDALPDGGFVLAEFRSTIDRQHVQVFDALGRSSWTFRMGDGIEHLIADEAGDLWVGYFDEGVYGDDPLSHPGLRRWSSTGEPLWSFRPGPGLIDMSDCVALNVDGGTAWACPYTHYPLIEVGGDGTVHVRPTSVRRVHGLAVNGERVVFLTGNGTLEHGRITQTAVEPEERRTLLARPDGGVLKRNTVVCRGSRIYVRERKGTDWSVFDLGQ